MKLRLVRRPIHPGQLGDVLHVGLADQHPRAGKFIRAERVHMRPHLLHHRVDAGQVVGLRVVQLRVAVCIDDRVAVLVLDDAFIGQLRVLKKVRNCIEPEPAHPALQPEADDVLEGLMHLGVIPVQVRLLDIELVVVVLPRTRVPLPRRVAEVRLPVIRRRALIGCGLALAIVPHIPVAVRIAARRPRLHEPLMLVRGVVHHHVHDHTDMPLARLGNQPVEVLQRPVPRVYVLVVGDVVAEVHLRRGIAGCQPDGVHAKIFEVVQPLRNAVQVADAVSVRVLETARVNLVDHGVLPPVPLTGGAGFM